MADISDWVATTAPLEKNNKGKSAALSEENCIAWRRNSEATSNGCVCYTCYPLPTGKVWQVTILDITSKWHYGYGESHFFPQYSYIMILCIIIIFSFGTLLWQ